MSDAPIAAEPSGAAVSNPKISSIAADAQLKTRTIGFLAEAINEVFEDFTFAPGDTSTRAAMDRLVLFLRLIEDTAASVTATLETIEIEDAKRRMAETRRPGAEGR